MAHIFDMPYVVDEWQADGSSVFQRVADCINFTVGLGAYEAACRDRPGRIITLRHRARVVRDSRRERPYPRRPAIDG
jgi:hypothetical protein